MAIRHHLASAVLALALTAGASAANATVTISVQSSDLPLPSGQSMVVDFDNPTAAGFTFTQGNAKASVRLGADGVLYQVSAPPPGDASLYETIAAGGFATLASDTLMSSFSLYMGSPDAFNYIEFIGPSFDVTLTGSELFDPATAFHGAQSVGRRVSYDFGGAAVNEIIFGSKGNAFEFDDLAASASPAPEPATWAMMLAGFFGLGAALRSRTRRRALVRGAA